MHTHSQTNKHTHTMLTYAHALTNKHTHTLINTHHAHTCTHTHANAYLQEPRMNQCLMLLLLLLLPAPL